MQDRERRDYIIITIALFILLLVMYLQAESGWVFAVIMIVSAVLTYGTYGLARWYKKRKTHDSTPQG